MRRGRNAAAPDGVHAAGARPAGTAALDLPVSHFLRAQQQDRELGKWLDTAAVRLAVARDVIPAWSVLSAGGRRVFREALAVDDAMWNRGRGWALSIAVIILPYYRHTHPAFVALATRMVDEILGDHAG